MVDQYTRRVPGWRVREAAREDWQPPTEEGRALKRAHAQAFDERAKLETRLGRHDERTRSAQEAQDTAEREWHSYIEVHFKPEVLYVDEVLFEEDGEPYTIMDLLEDVQRTTSGIGGSIAPSMRRRIPDATAHAPGTGPKFHVDVDGVQQAHEKLEDIIHGTTRATRLLQRGLDILQARSKALTGYRTKQETKA